MSIEQLPPATQTRLRSTQILSSLTQVVSELLQNSLDANALHIDVGVNCEEWTCWVTDDGSGISRDALGVIGEELDGGRYNTSKPFATHGISALETFGFRGEALASIADLSCLEICSRTARSRDTWSMIVKGGKNLYNGSAVRWRRESPGTTVHVRDAFYNLPVRRRSHPPPARVLEQIRHELEVYALMFPRTSFSLRNLQDQRGAWDSTWRIPKTGSTLATFCHLYGKALAKHVEEVDLVSGDMKLNGFISLVGAPSKMYQFLYVNKHHMSQCDLHRVVHSVFATSTFHRNAPDDENDSGLPTNVSRRSPRKWDKRPVYVLNLTLPPECIDNCLEPDKSAIHIQDVSTVASFLASAIRGFLIRQGFLDESTNDGMTDQGNSEPLRKRRRTQNQERGNDPKSADERMERHNSGPAPPSVDLHHDSELQKWTDNRTGQSFIIDSRTGNTFSQAKNLLLNDYREERRTLSSQSLMPGTQSVGPETPDWVREALKNNSAYATNDVRIPTYYGGYEAWPRKGEKQTDSSDASHHFEKSDLTRAEVIGQVDRKFVACVFRGRVTASKSELLEPDGREHKTMDGLRLVLIDQHAADERIRVERYLKELCQGFLDSRKYGDASQNGIKVHIIEPPMPLLLTRYECLKLASSDDLQQFFAWWGIRFFGLSEVEAHGTESCEYIQVLVTSVPKVISDKLTTNDELRDLIKSILSRPMIEGLNNQESDLSTICFTDELGWLGGLRCCPQELLELINSKACRGAIMFNDSLDLEQCKKLVHQLSKTVFPFQCAHGRPSLVPIANVINSGPRRREVTGCGWSRLEQSEVHQGIGFPMDCSMRSLRGTLL